MILLILSLLTFSLSLCSFVQPPYPVWAHSHWVWLNGKTQNQSNLQQMVSKYQSYNISVGALNIDSAWSTGFNNFKWNYTKFPNPKGLIDKMHHEGIRVIAWVTSLVNNDSSNFQEGKVKGYFLNKGGLIKWWHGHGAFLDYRNKQAVEWWHRQMDEVLDIGLDGWKTDGSDPILLLLKPWPYSQKKTHVVTYRQYADSYYGDFFNYTKTKNPAGLIMSRPVDNGLEEFYLSYSPKYVMYSGWVGDQDSSYDGLRFAMKNVFQSAWRGYLNFGFDIGGYRGQNISKEGFLRYMQVGALLPLMENGGNGRHCPWLYDDETVEIYRKFVNLHLSLMPYFLTAAAEALNKKVSVIEPLAKKQHWIAPSDPSSFGYLLWQDLLVYPIFNDQGHTSIDFPKNSNWVYYFNHEKVFRDNNTVRLKVDLDETALFLRENSTIPLDNRYILVYPSAKNYSRTIINENYTDYVRHEKQKERFEMTVERYWRSGGSGSNTVTVEIVGARKYTVDGKYEPRFKDNTLIVRVPVNTTFVIPDLVVGSIEEEKQAESLLLQ